MSALYVDIAVVRIQRYLSRTPKLRGHRGASAALSQATQNNKLEQLLAADSHLSTVVEVNDEAGEADGVVSLRLDDPRRRDTVIDWTFGHLRGSLPGAEFHAVSGEGQTYLDAYSAEMKPKIEAGRVRSGLPRNAEFPPAAPCRLCRNDPAVDHIDVVGDGDRAACPDCVMRFRDQAPEVSEAAEQRLAAELGLEPAPETFDQLAATAGANGNHLATVYIDGNAVGDFFDAVAKASIDDPELRAAKKDLSRQLSEATWEALVSATRAVGPGAGKELRVIPHVVGGDDVLASLPAPLAWPFVRTCLETFTERMRSLTGPLIGRLTGSHEQGESGERNSQNPPHGIIRPSTSAGMVIARENYPFNLMVEEAERCLKQAKQAVSGRESSVQFVDITADGPGAPSGPPLTLRALEDTSDELTALAEVPRSHRARLAKVLDTHGPLTAESTALRVGHVDAVTPFLSPPDEPDRASPSGIELSHALRIARWWT